LNSKLDVASPKKKKQSKNLLRKASQSKEAAAAEASHVIFHIIALWYTRNGYEQIHQKRIETGRQKLIKCIY
jgi:hypothetical protein